MWRGWDMVEVLSSLISVALGTSAGQESPSRVAPHSFPPKRSSWGQSPTPPCSPKTVSVVVLMYLWCSIRLHLYCPCLGVPGLLSY